MRHWLAVLALQALLVCTALADDDFHFQQCSSDPVFSVSDVAISPNPAVHGQDILVTLSGVNAREVTAASLTVTIYYRGWPIQRQRRDICNGDRPVTPPCPFEPGNLTITSSDSVPLIAPVGPYSMRMQAWDQGGAGVMCIDIWFRVTAQPSSVAALEAAGGDVKREAAGGERRRPPQGVQRRQEQQQQQAAAAAAGRLGGRKWMRPELSDDADPWRS